MKSKNSRSTTLSFVDYDAKKKQKPNQSFNN